MRRFLMRGGMSPLDNFSPETVLCRDSIGDNSGNLVYVYGIYRTLLTENTQIVMDYYAAELGRYTDEDIARINKEYDAYICPLADAFRESFENNLVRLTHFFERLSIPCYVIGAGISAPYEPDIRQARKFDDSAKRFVNAVLKKSSIIGVRGEITAAYLKRLGFREDVDFTPIGCPSMYTGGANLTQRSLTLTKDTRICFNCSKGAPQRVQKFILGAMQVYENHFLIGQRTEELKSQYCSTFPLFDGVYGDIVKMFMQEGRYHVFINFFTWLKFLENIDFSIGSRLHGNIAAVLAGCPVIFFPFDSRMREIIAYHNLPQVLVSDIRENEQLEDLIERVDMTSHIKAQTVNFKHFLEFLNSNRIDHIYNYNLDCLETPLDILVKDICYQKVLPLSHCSREELLLKISYLNEDNYNKMNKIKRLEEKSRFQQKTIKKLKSVRKEQDFGKNDLEILQRQSIIKKITSYFCH